MYICISIDTLCMYKNVCRCTCIHSKQKRIQLFMYANMCVCTYVHICMYVRMYVCVCICICVLYGCMESVATLWTI